MQGQHTLEPQKTSRFNVQKINTSQPPQKRLRSLSTINKTNKNSQLFDNFFSNNHTDFSQDNFQPIRREIQQQETKKRISLFQNTENMKENDKNMRKEVPSFTNFQYKEPTLAFEEQENNIIPSFLRESLQSTSRIHKKQSKLQQRSTNIQNMENNNESKNSSNVEIDQNLIRYLSQAQQAAKRQRIEYKKLSLCKQIAITYVPVKHTKTNFYQKFGKGYNDKQILNSSQSLYNNKSQQENLLQDCMVNSTANFTKLHEMDLFMKRKEIRLERSGQLLLANQKLLSGHLVEKQQLQKIKKTLYKVTSQYKSKIQHLEHELKLQKQSKSHILAEKEAKQLGLKSIKSLNQQYLKDNNVLKEKIKDYIKTIHLMKYLQQTKNNSHQNHHQKHANLSIKTIDPHINTIKSLPSHHIDTDRHHEPIHSKKHTKIHQQNDYHLAKNHQKKKETLIKAKNHLNMQNERIYTINDYNTQKNPSNLSINTQSQKNIIIKGNFTPKESGNINKSFLKFDKKTSNDNSFILKYGEDKHNKSLSSYSNMSGISSTNKIGHILKPQQSKKGVLLDYLAQEANEVEKEHKYKDQIGKYKYWGL